MPEALIVDCCIRRDDSRTRKLLNAFTDHLSDAWEKETLCLMDEDLKPLVNDFYEERQKLLELGERNHPRFRYAWQMRNADLVVMAAPFWDMSFPALLKVYMENCSVDGITFHSEESGLVGDCRARELIYLTTRGGFYTGDPMEQAVPYLESIAKFWNLGKVEVIAADGMDVAGTNPEGRLKDAVQKAVRKAESL